jgi:hypothetical protein
MRIHVRIVSLKPYVLYILFFGFHAFLEQQSIYTRRFRFRQADIMCVLLTFDSPRRGSCGA